MTVRIFTGADAQANVVGMPANIMLYGGPGVGKSTDAVMAFVRDGRCNAFVIPCEDGALKPIPARGLPTPEHSDTVKTWSDMTYVIGYLAQNRGRYSACIVDGMSAFTNNLYREAEQTYKGSRNKYEIPTAVRGCLFLLREWIRALGMHSVFLAHIKPPAVEDGIFYPGSPLLQPKSMVEIYYGLIDTVLRVDYLMNPLQLGQPPLRVYHTGGTEWPAELGPSYPPPPDWRAWRVKNREGVNLAVVPADLGAYLRMRQPPYAGL
jgi:hypothetical protein